jgi:acetyltransferase
VTPLAGCGGGAFAPAARPGWPAGDALAWLDEPSAGAAYEAVRAAPPVALDVFTLKDGRRVAIRVVDPRDALAEDRFVGGLSLDSRYHRFHAPIRRLSPDLLRRMVSADPRQFALVAEPLDALADGWEEGAAGTPLVADARFVMAEAGDDVAEFALAVADDWQRAGLGRALLDRLVARARSRGIRTLHGDVLHDNYAMAGLLADVGGRFVRGEDARVRRGVVDTGAAPA